jgi:hypothetical protein
MAERRIVIDRVVWDREGILFSFFLFSFLSFWNPLSLSFSLGLSFATFRSRLAQVRDRVWWGNKSSLSQIDVMKRGKRSFCTIE